MLKKLTIILETLFLFLYPLPRLLYFSNLKHLMNKLLTFHLFLFLVFLSSCRTPKDLEFREVKNISLENVGFSAATDEWRERGIALWCLTDAQADDIAQLPAA